METHKLMNADFERVLNRRTAEPCLEHSDIGSREKLADSNAIDGMNDHLRKENITREEIDNASMFEEILTISPSMKTVLSLVGKDAPTDSTVGETRGCRQMEEL